MELQTATTGGLDVVQFEPILLKGDRTLQECLASGDKETLDEIATRYIASAAFCLEMDNAANQPVSNSSGDYPVHVAARSGSASFLRFLIERGADVNAMNAEETTALMIGVQTNDVAVVQVLCEVPHVNVEITNTEGLNARLLMQDDTDVAIRQLLSTDLSGTEEAKADGASPAWTNWGENQYHITKPDISRPRTREQLQAILQEKKAHGMRVRVEGQTHAQPPLILHHGSVNVALIDLSLYRDVSPSGMKITETDNTCVQVNTGVTETELDKFLGAQDPPLSLQTVTAGGFFSIGGITSVDVNGATVNSGIFADHVIEFEIMDADGNITKITQDTPADETDEKAGKAIDFARVNLGALGVVTSVTIQCIRRDKVTGSVSEFITTDCEDFAKHFVAVLHQNQRVESFFNNYNGKYVIGCWNLLASSAEATSLEALDLKKGAPVTPGIDLFAEASQYWGMNWWWIPVINSPTKACDLVLNQSRTWMQEAMKNGEELWLTESIIRCMFMSYYIPIGALNEEGVKTAWRAMNEVTELNKEKVGFNTVAPMEFRFVKGGTSALSGAYSADEDTWFVNLDLIGYLDILTTGGVKYKPDMMKFFSDVEQKWFFEYNGLPHGGKMYGFYDPATGQPATAPFNDSFLVHLLERRAERAHKFNVFRKKMDGGGMFSCKFVEDLVGQ